MVAYNGGRGEEPLRGLIGPLDALRMRSRIGDKPGILRGAPDLGPGLGIDARRDIGCGPRWINTPVKIGPQSPPDDSDNDHHYQEETKQAAAP
jgi:hypothetical protein